MRCSDFENELNALLDARSSLVLSQQAQSHCADCLDCTELLAGYEALFSVLSVPSPASNSPAVPANASSVETASPSRRFRIGEQVKRESGSLFDKTRKPRRKPVASINPVTSIHATPVSQSTIPVAAPEVEPAVSQAPLQVQWNPRTVILALVPVAAAVYILGFTLLSLPDGSAPDGKWNVDRVSRNSMMSVADGTTNGNVPGLNAGREFASFDWQQTAKNFDSGWRGIAIQRAGVCQLPGTQAYFYPINGAVEAFRTKVILSDNQPKDENQAGLN